jgi:hypothetical protein
MDENIRIAKKIFGELSSEEKNLWDECVGMALAAIVLEKRFREEGKQFDYKALMLYTGTCAERTRRAIEKMGEKINNEEQKHIEESILKACPSIFIPSAAPETNPDEPGTDSERAETDWGEFESQDEGAAAEMQEDTLASQKVKERAFVSCVTSAALDLSAEDQEEVARAIATVACYAIANEVTDAEGAVGLLASVPEEAAVALGRFGANVMDKLSPALRSQLMNSSG